MVNDPWSEVKDNITSCIEAAMKKLGWSAPRPVRETLEEPPTPDLGDVASTVCFDLARTLRMSPQEISARLSKQVEKSELVSDVKAAGGYVNFFLNFSRLAEITIKSVEKAGVRYGCCEPTGKKVVVEHTSINPTKPLHIGHGRNAVIGDTIVRVMKALGHRVEVHNYVDDMGRQMAETVLAYKIIKKKPRAKFDHLLGLIYAEMHRQLEADLNLNNRVNEILEELENGKGRWSSEARRIAERCVDANLKTASRLNVGYDLLVWESDLVRSGVIEEVIEKLKKTGRLVEGTGDNAGAMLIRLNDLGIEDKILIRSDRTTVYTARDIAYQLWKFGKTRRKPRFKIHSRKAGRTIFTTSPNGRTISKFGMGDIVINVIGAEQRFPQQVVTAALKVLGHDEESKRSMHLAYEHVWLPTGKFSGRKGTWVGFSVDDVIEEAVARAMSEVEKHSPESDRTFKKKIAEMVGVGAIRFSLLSTSPEKKITFRWEDALNFERNSGPAVQYSHARARSILKKAGKFGAIKNYRLSLPEEKRLVKLIARFPEVVRMAGDMLAPHLLALYASDLAISFNKFYEVAPVISAETDEIRLSRLHLVKCVAITLKNAINLLGIEAPERM
ncbi:MAG: arginine--tRNA ligase [Candidatus Hadarchaeales archaeon]